MWHEFEVPGLMSGPVRHSSFEAFATTPSPRGLDLDSVDQLMGMCTGADRNRALSLIDEACRNPDGNPTGRNQHSPPVDEVGTFDNIQGSLPESSTVAPTGTSQSAALRRLRTQRPDLHARVLANELSPHAAMVEAGFRRRTVSVRPDDPESIIATLRRQMTSEKFKELQAMILPRRVDMIRTVSGPDMVEALERAANIYRDTGDLSGWGFMLALDRGWLSMNLRPWDLGIPINYLSSVGGDRWSDGPGLLKWIREHEVEEIIDMLLHEADVIRAVDVVSWDHWSEA